MVNFAKLLAELMAERDKLDAAISAVARLSEGALSLPKPRGRPAGSSNKTKRTYELQAVQNDDRRI